MTGAGRVATLPADSLSAAWWCANCCTEANEPFCSTCGRTLRHEPETCISCGTALGHLVLHTARDCARLLTAQAQKAGAR